MKKLFAFGLFAFIFAIPIFAQDGNGLFELETIAYIVSVVLALLSTFFGVRYAKVKAALKETKEAVIAIIDAVEDDAVSPEEQEEIVKETKEAAHAWGLVFKK